MRDRSFFNGQLTPHTEYTFRVAGVNNNGTGPFTDIVSLTTDEDSKLIAGVSSFNLVHLGVLSILPYR